MQKSSHLNGHMDILKYHVKVLPKRFQLNGHTTTAGSHPQTQKLEPHTKYIAPCESAVKEISFE